MLLSDIKSAEFSPGILSVYIICIILYTAVFVLTYSYFFNNRAKLYRKMKINMSSIILVVFMFVMFLALAIMISIQHVYFKKNAYMLPMTWIITIIALGHLIVIVVITKLINQKKKNIENFRNEDFQTILDNLQKNKPSDEYLDKFKQKNQRYYSILEQKYIIINSVLDQYKSGSYTEVLTSIIMFNDTETTRWSKKRNYLQLEMFLNLCLKLQQKAKI